MSVKALPRHPIRLFARRRFKYDQWRPETCGAPIPVLWLRAVRFSERIMGKPFSFSILSVLCLAMLCLSSVRSIAADGGWMGFRNDTNSPIVIQGVSIINRVPRQGPRHTLQPGQECWDVMIAKGNKLILIADAKLPTRSLMQETVTYSGTDLFFSVQPDATIIPLPNAPRAGIVIPKVKISTSKPTTSPPKGGGLGVANQKR
jgi:hypothetical protein